VLGTAFQPDERTRRGLTAIEREARAQAQLIEDLLDVSRIERGQLRLDVQTVNLSEVVSAAVETIRAAADAKSIALETIVDSRLDFVAGDPGRLQQVVWNLVSNAVKFTPRGGKIQVRVQRINSNMEIVVADNGQGIVPGLLPFVFDRFWQAEHRNGAAHGVGLGLSIVKEIITLHGGTVTVHSDGLGKGATFTARLPLPVTRGISKQPRQHSTVALLTSTAGAPRLDGVSILAVDDEPGAGEALKNLLASLGANVVTVTSAKATLTVLDKLHPDAVISDLGMPLHDGYFLAKALRERELNTGARMPLVALTAYGRVEDRVQTLAAGFDNHLVKPVDAAELAAVLRTLNPDYFAPGIRLGDMTARRRCPPSASAISRLCLPCPFLIEKLGRHILRRQRFPLQRRPTTRQIVVGFFEPGGPAQLTQEKVRNFSRCREPLAEHEALLRVTPSGPEQSLALQV
jgi:CheY-like chemotaxis protein/anti-sigma regulatory factor (Ser/Thr protein kinase)